MIGGEARSFPNICMCLPSTSWEALGPGPDHVTLFLLFLLVLLQFLFFFWLWYFVLEPFLALLLLFQLPLLLLLLDSVDSDGLADAFAASRLLAPFRPRLSFVNLFYLF